MRPPMDWGIIEDQASRTRRFAANAGTDMLPGVTRLQESHIVIFVLVLGQFIHGN